MEVKREVQSDSILTAAVAKKLAREIWLNYFNNTLYAKGLISEAEMRKIRRMISK